VSIVYWVRNVRGLEELQKDDFSFAWSFYVALVEPSSALDQRLRSLGLMPSEYGIIVHGIGREIGRNVYSIIPHPLGENNDIVESRFSTSSHDIRPRESGEKFSIFATAGRNHEFRCGREVSVIFCFFWVDVANICADDAGGDGARGAKMSDLELRK